MIRVFEAVVARRLLVNFRIDPEAARAVLPDPLEPLLRAGSAVGGVSLVRLEQLRPRGLKPLGGLTIEVLAHRLAVRAPGEDGRSVPGVFVLRRDVERRLVVALGGRLFGGDHRLSRFEVEEDARRIRAAVRPDDERRAVDIEAEWGASFRPSPLFGSLDEAAGFFGECERGYFPGRRPGELEAVRLAPSHARPEGVRIGCASVELFGDEALFPKGSTELDSAFGERSLPLEWVRVRELPEILDEPLLPEPAGA